jgi:molybdopterin-containing oxidoreductase family iron-sulfur binding subunit
MIELPVLDDSPELADQPRNRFWRSISHLEGAQEFKQMNSGEFLPGASNGPAAEGNGGASRRQFIQLMGASMAMAGLTACRKPVETILPYVRQPEDRVEGVPVQYATSMPFRGVLRPLLVESFDGRPTKVEGNPEHPDSNGSTHLFEQASILSLYDPDRLGTVRNGSTVSEWSFFRSFVAGLPTSSRVVVIAEPTSSMTMATVRRQMQQRFNSVRWVDYHGAVGNNAAQGVRAAFGRSARVMHDLAAARVIVSLDADLFASTGPDPVSASAGFSAGRDPEAMGGMNRLYVVESGYSITGGMADHRQRMKSSEIASFAAALASELGAWDGETGIHGAHPWISEMAADLRSAGSSALVVAGDNQPAGVHALVAAINDRLGAVGTTVTYLDNEESAADASAELEAAIADMAAGNVDVVLTLGTNPVYDHPAFAAAFASVEHRVHLGMYMDETASQATWVVPQTHYLEAWGDGTSRSGIPGVIQPLIAPLYADAHSDIEVVGLFATGTDMPGYEMVRATWRNEVSGSFETAWRKVIHDGFGSGGGFSAARVSVSASGVQSAMTGVDLSGGTDVEVVISADAKLFDGRFANNAWLQELPDPTTKVVWDNVAQMNPATAEKLGVSAKLDAGKYFSDVVSLSAAGHSVELPVWIQPGMADDSIHVKLGYGRDIVSERAERHTNFFDLDDYTDVYGKGAISTGVGVNTAPLASNGLIAAVDVSKAGDGYLVASTQDHGAIDAPHVGEEVKSRGLFRMATVEEYRANPDFVKGGEPAPLKEDWEDYPTLWEANHPKAAEEITSSNYHDNQWGMVIDLNTCTGCNACVMACQAENNIQVVGKDEVSRGREMHWLRLDRYFVSGDGSSYEDPQMVIQPMPCQHCENAPCEQVCPVAATVHSPDGTNQMIYNRCIGTRYCANNCPYKVRRFNYFNWTKTLPDTLHMASNPNVTVRSRGVMEKCSFCIQRIRGANKVANIENRQIEDGEVVTACQQVCPANAITFGDLSDPDSAVSRRRQSDRRYELLAELNVKPRVSYLGRVTNPNPNLA